MATMDTNFQQLRADAVASNDEQLVFVVDRAWMACEDIDCYCEWGDQTLGCVLDALRDHGQGGIACHLAEAAGIAA